jgi:protein tyrosine/serine phosphatase
LRQLQPRDLVWDGCLNVRDLGGLPTRAGGETRFGAVVRADSVRQLSDEGWQALVDHGVRTVIDLRGDHERAEDADAHADAPVEVVEVPLLSGDKTERDALGDELDAAVAAAPDVPTATRDVYLIFLDRYRSNVAAAVRAVAHASPGGIVVHCAGGKDRTGLLSALLLHLAGVDDEDIAADYALSEERLRPRHETWFAAAETEEELERLERIAQTPPAAMVGVFAELERRYGGVEEYLLGAGVTTEELELARARLGG